MTLSSFKLADMVKAIRVKYGLEYCFLGMKKAHKQTAEEVVVAI